MRILLTEAQLPKNPLTIPKLLPSLPRGNSLVKQYLALKKEHSTLFNRYTTYIAKIHERLDFFRSEAKKQRKEQIRENSEKPLMGEVKELIENMKLSPVDMER